MLDITKPSKVRDRAAMASEGAPCQNKVMEPSLDNSPVESSSAPGPQAPLDAAYCGPEPDFTEIAAVYAAFGLPR